MPSYNNPANNTSSLVQQAVPGLSTYLFGALARTTAPTRMTLTSFSITSNVALITATVIEGNAPVAGQLFSILNSSSAILTAAGVQNVAIAASPAPAASNTPDNGVWTFSVAFTHANVGATAFTGAGFAAQVETTEALVNSSSVPAALQANTGPNNGQTIRCDVEIPSLPTTATIVVQTSDIDLDANYQTLGTVASVAGGVLSGGSVVFANVRANFVRYKVSAVTGGSSPTIIAKVLV